MATPDTAIVHSSRQVEPIQPKITISVTLSPMLAKAASARREPQHEAEPDGELGEGPNPHRGDDEVGMAQRPFDRALHPQRAGERVRELGGDEARRIEVELHGFVDAVDGVEVVDQPPASRRPRR